MAAMPPAASDAAARPILMIAPQPFFRVTGTPINVLTMCRALTEHGLAVHLLTVPDGEDVDQVGDPGLVGRAHDLAAGVGDGGAELLADRLGHVEDEDGALLGAAGGRHLPLRLL